jgi:hypothetical protein
MNLRATRTKRTRSYRIEGLEDRSLLNGAVPTLAPAEVQLAMSNSVAQILKGTIKGTFTLKSGTVVFAGHGSLGVTGVWTLSGKYTETVNHKTGVITVSGGTATATDSVGDRLTVKFTGSGTGTSTFTFSFKGTVTGGTGHFKGATGTFTAGLTANKATGSFVETVTINVK